MADSTIDSNPAPPRVRVAIVTGAAQGIGKAIALRLADDGLDVAVAGREHKRDQVEELVATIRAKGRQSIALFGDVSVEEDVVAMVARTVNELGGLDVMVANAGIFGTCPITDLSVEEWDKFLTVNARSVMLCYKHAAREMIKQGRGGRIIGAGSTTSKKGFMNVSAYCASKFAIRGLTQCTALELWEHGITVNSFAPGVIATQMTTDAEDEANGGVCATLFKNLAIPFQSGAVADPAVIAELVSYMVKPHSWFLTGQCIAVNSGMTMD